MTPPNSCPHGLYSVGSCSDCSVNGDMARRPQPSGETRARVMKEVLDAVFSGFEHGECEKEWEPEYGKEIASLATDAILALLSARPLALGGQHSGGEEGQ
jgi:hypothetical protein